MKLVTVTLIVVLAWQPAASAQAQESTVSRTAAAVSDVRDTASLFGSNEVEAARGRLRELEAELKVPTVVETIDSLRGKSIDDVAVALARRSGMSGIFVLIAKRENKLEVLPSHRIEAALPRAKRNAIRGAFIEKFRKKDFDAGLKQGVEAIAVALREAARDDKLPTSTDFAPPRKPIAGTDLIPSPGPRKLESPEEAAKEFGIFRNVGVGHNPIPIVRDQVRLTLEGAQVIIAGAKQRAESLSLKSNIWVVDDGGHPLAFERMDGARPASAYTALTKAASAATYRQPTGPIPVGSAQPDLLLNVGIQNAAAVSGGKITTLLGGIPIVVDGQVIGGVGVGGGSGEQDVTIAKAGFDHFLSAIKAIKPPSEKPAETLKPITTTATPPKEKDAESKPKEKAPDSKPDDDRDF